MELSPRQAEIRRFIGDYHQEKGYSPTLREISEGVGLSISTIVEHVKAMRAKGAIAWEPGSPRSIHLAGEP
jgi:repressor LexA